MNMTQISDVLLQIDIAKNHLCMLMDSRHGCADELNEMFIFDEIKHIQLLVLKLTECATENDLAEEPVVENAAEEIPAEAEVEEPINEPVDVQLTDASSTEQEV